MRIVHNNRSHTVIPLKLYISLILLFKALRQVGQLAHDPVQYRRPSGDYLAHIQRPLSALDVGM